MRSLPGVVLPLVVVSLTLIWTFGLLGAFGVTLGVASVLLPPLILLVARAGAFFSLSSSIPARMKGPTPFGSFSTTGSPM